MIGIVVGSDSDLEIMNHCVDKLNELGISNEIVTASAHRNPEKVSYFAQNARKNGYKILIGGAGMAAHLAGALKANSVLPVIGLPLPGGLQDGIDALLSTVQMPKGVPVATMGVGKSGAINAAILCAEIFALSDSKILNKLLKFKKSGCVISET